MANKKYKIQLTKQAYKDLKRLTIAARGVDVKKKDVLSHVESVIFDSVIDLDNKISGEPKSIRKQDWGELREAEKVENLKQFAKENGIDEPIIDLLEESYELKAYIIAKSFTNSLAIEKICEKMIPMCSIYSELDTFGQDILEKIKEVREGIVKEKEEKNKVNENTPDQQPKE